MPSPGLGFGFKVGVGGPQSPPFLFSSTAGLEGWPGWQAIPVVVAGGRAARAPPAGQGRTTVGPRLGLGSSWDEPFHNENDKYSS